VIAGKAHEGAVLCVAWNAVSGQICTTGEEADGGRFRIWGPSGALLRSSETFPYVVHTAAWTPQGTMLAVGTFNGVLLCDASGQVLAKQRLSVFGSVFGLAWTADGMQVAAAGGSGRLAWCDVVGTTVNDASLVATLEEATSVRVVYLQSSGSIQEELLDTYRDRVVALSAGYGHLVVGTTSQTYVYRAGQWNNPSVLDAKGPLLFLKQAPNCFLVADALAGLRVFSYDARSLCTPQFAGVPASHFNPNLCALSADTIAVTTRGKPTVVEILDSATGRPAGPPLSHVARIVRVGLSQGGNASSRLVSVLDENGDLFVALTNAGRLTQVASVVSSSCWHSDEPCLAAVQDGSLSFWWCPASAFMDPSLLGVAHVRRDEIVLPKATELVEFQGARARLRGGDGVVQEVDVPPFAIRLHQLAQKGQWAESLRLCRFAKEKGLWACLAGLALRARELDSAELAYAAIDAVDRVEFMSHLQSIRSEEGRTAELAVFFGDVDTGEETLLRANLIWRALDLNMSLFRWERALELALKHKTHVDTVLLRRAQYLEAAGLEETFPAFVQYNAKVEVDEEAIEAKIQNEYEQEAARPGAKTWTPTLTAA
jgi:intraflagellar transport protein 80